MLHLPPRIEKVLHVAESCNGGIVLVALQNAGHLSPRLKTPNQE